MMTAAEVLLVISALVTPQKDWTDFTKEIDKEYIQAKQDMLDPSFNSFMDRILVRELMNIKNKNDKSFKRVLYILAIYHKQELKLPKVIESYLEEKGKTLFERVIKILDKEMAGD